MTEERGGAYKHFLRQVLEPNGTIILSKCGLTWPVTNISNRYTFQFGAVGVATHEEYRHGGSRVQAFLSRYGAPPEHWDSPAPDSEAPEAEWGFAPALCEDAEQFADANGYHFARLTFNYPEQLSPLVEDFYRGWNAARSLPTNRMLVESFILLEPWWTMRLGAVPFWMTFNTEPSASWLETYLNRVEPFDELYMMLFAHGTDSIGLAPIERWQAILKRARNIGQFAGVDEKRYPRDFAVFGRYHSSLLIIPGRFPMPKALSLHEVLDFLQKEGGQYGIEWLEQSPGRKLQRR